MDLSATLGTYMVPIVVAVCLCAGYVIKHAVPNEEVNRFIPLIVAVLGVAMNAWAAGFQFTPEVLAGGLVSGLASTGLYEAYKQIIDGKKEA